MDNLNLSNTTRRDFIKSGAALSTLTLIGNQGLYANAHGSDKLKVGVVGCGGRGTGAAHQLAFAAPNIEIFAIADFFQDKLDRFADTMKTGGENWGRNLEPLGERWNVTPDRMFTGFDGYQKVLDSGVDIVILATQPYFRPRHFEAAVNAGVHTFLEKPVAVDPVGVRSIIESAQKAKEKNLCVLAGTQRHHDPSYLQMMQRVKDGAIGDLVSGQCYWIWGRKIGQNDNNPAFSEMEEQIRNWYFYCYQCGDCIVEQHMHNIDVMNWAYGGPPKSAIGMGGLMIEHERGNIYDHFSVEFEYENGARVQSMCSQIPNSANRIGENIVGTKGTAQQGRITGANEWKYEGEHENPYVQELKDLVASIRGDAPYMNHGQRVAESTLTAIMGRMAAYTGKTLSYGWVLNRSQLKLGPDKWEIGPNPIDPRPIPGMEPLV